MTDRLISTFLLGWQHMPQTQNFCRTFLLNFYKIKIHNFIVFDVLLTKIIYSVKGPWNHSCVLSEKDHKDPQFPSPHCSNEESTCDPTGWFAQGGWSRRDETPTSLTQGSFHPTTPSICIPKCFLRSLLGFA